MTVTDTMRTFADLYDEAEEPAVPQPTREELLTLIGIMQADWVKLNEFLNATAIYYRWCNDWEQRIWQYNAQLRVLRLQGREDANIGGNPDDYLLPALARETVDRDAENALVARSQEIYRETERARVTEYEQRVRAEHERTEQARLAERTEQARRAEHERIERVRRERAQGGGGWGATGVVRGEIHEGFITCRPVQSSFITIAESPECP